MAFNLYSTSFHCATTQELYDTLPLAPLYVATHLTVKRELKLFPMVLYLENHTPGIKFMDNGFESYHSE